MNSAPVKLNFLYAYTAWAAADISSEGAVAPVADDSSNPWGDNSEPTPHLGPTPPDGGGWAHFESAGFSDFETNFWTGSITDIANSRSTSDCENSHQETPNTASNVSDSAVLVECK